MLQPARALHLQRQRVQRIGDVGDLAPAQRRHRRRQRFELLPRPVGLAGRQVGRRPVQRHAIRAAPLARGVDERLEVAGGQAFGRAVVRLDAVRLQPLHQPGSRGRVVDRRSRAARRRTARSRRAAGVRSRAAARATARAHAPRPSRAARDHVTATQRERSRGDHGARGGGSGSSAGSAAAARGGAAAWRAAAPAPATGRRRRQRALLRSPQPSFAATSCG